MGIEMQSTALTQVIAKKVFMKSAKVPEQLQKSKSISTDNDTVQISSTASKMSAPDVNMTEFEKERAVNLERIKNQVNSKTYTMDKQVIDKIAEKIADMLV